MHCIAECASWVPASPIPRYAALLLCLCGSWDCAPPASGSTPELILEEVATLPLPQGVQIRGAIRFSDRTFYWTQGGAWILWDSGGKAELTCDGRPVRLVGAGRTTEGISALDTSRAAALLFDEANSCTTVSIRAVLLNDAVAAAPAPSGWFLLRRGAGSIEFNRLLRNGTDQKLVDVPLPLPLLDSVARAWLYLSSVGGSVVVGTHRPPFQWVRLDDQGRPTVTSAWRGPAAAAGSEVEPNWHGLPPLDLGKGYLQVLVDLASDRRLLRILDQSGNEIRSRELIGAIAFIASDPWSASTVAVRVLEVTELVVYRWRWTTARFKGVPHARLP